MVHPLVSRQAPVQVRSSFSPVGMRRSSSLKCVPSLVSSTSRAHISITIRPPRTFRACRQVQLRPLRRPGIDVLLLQRRVQRGPLRRVHDCADVIVVRRPLQRRLLLPRGVVLLDRVSVQPGVLLPRRLRGASIVPVGFLRLRVRAPIERVLGAVRGGVRLRLRLDVLVPEPVRPRHRRQRRVGVALRGLRRGLLHERLRVAHLLVLRQLQRGVVCGQRVLVLRQRRMQPLLPRLDFFDNIERRELFKLPHVRLGNAPRVALVRVERGGRERSEERVLGPPGGLLNGPLRAMAPSRLSPRRVYRSLEGTKGPSWGHHACRTQARLKRGARGLAPRRLLPRDVKKGNALELASLLQ